jgi:hypothetical protein
LFLRVEPAQFDDATIDTSTTPEPPRNDPARSKAREPSTILKIRDRS